MTETRTRNLRGQLEVGMHRRLTPGEGVPGGRVLLWFIGLAISIPGNAATPARAEFTRDFAPSESWVKPVEQPFRAEVCLNGVWQFQPVTVSASFKRGGGEPPELPQPRPNGWEATPIKIPSPWNVNTWGCGRNVGAGTDHPFWPDSVYFPSYPAAWDVVEMGWLRRSFRVPADWANRRLVLHFEAVAGDCQVFVNGQPAGTHFDKYLPFELDITRFAKREADNELLVGVRAHALFDKRSARYSKMRAPYPCGSETERLVGIWQDVFLLGLPPMRIEEVFVKPLVSQDTVELEVTVRNDSERGQTVAVGGDVSSWGNLAGSDILSAPEPQWKLDRAVFTLPASNITIAAGATSKLVLRERVNGQLKLWAPGSPNLNAAVLSLARGGTTVDRHFTCFGWRQFALKGSEVFLNGQAIQLYGDLLHPFGPFTMSRRYVWAWYRLIQDFGGNAVRPHAQPHPRAYLDLADEMGLVVLDETALFGSSIALNFEEPVAWQRFAEHYDGLVLRDRNHPSVVGWSFGNELFAIFNLNNVSKEDTDRWYRQLAELGARARRLDSTREWISCDGDEDLRGTLPVWGKHFGHGTPLDRLPTVNKPLMVGESGGTYYARSKQMVEFNGPRAFESYAGRNEALAIDVYDNIVRMARPRLAYFSASETAWFGIEHLNYGYRDFTRLPGREDGVFFTMPFVEGKPGIQPERLPPYVATLNPGWDPSLPLYKPLAMFHAQKAALAKDGPQVCAWDHRPKLAAPTPASVQPTVEKVAFIGERNGTLARRLTALGVPLAEGEHAFTIVDAARLNDAALAVLKQALDSVHARGGTVLLMLGQATDVTIQPFNASTNILPASLRLTDRSATALVPDARHPWTAPFTLPDLYFAEDGPDRFIMRQGLTGPLLEGARVLLRASDTDWSLFNTAPENAKCAAVVLHEQLVKPAGTALAERAHGAGKLLFCSIDYRVASRSADTFWRRLFTNAGIKLGPPADAATPAFDEQGALVNALATGRFSAPDLDAALATDFVGEATAQPMAGTRVGNLTWQPVNSPSRDRFIFREMKQSGPESEPFAVYFSYRIRSLRALDDLLADGPDAPRFTMFCYVSEKCRVFLNGRELPSTRAEPADYRARVVFENVPLRKGWNHFLVKVASHQLQGEHLATLAVRIGSNSEEYLRQIESAIEAN